MSSAQSATSIGVLFVCMGNICRSPMAEGAFRQLLTSAGAIERFTIDSAGTHDYHTGRAPDARAVATAHRHGVDISGSRARPVDTGDFYLFDHIMAADAANLDILKSMAPADGKARPGLLMAYAQPGYPDEIPDPYYGPGDGFERVYKMISAACRGLWREFDRISTAQTPSPSFSPTR